MRGRELTLDERRRRPSWPRRLFRAFWILILLVLLVVLGAGLWLRGRLAASLPDLDGEISVAGPSAEVILERDSFGIVTVRGAARGDVAFGTGFAHAQDRFFQMDFFRRQAAGEVSELMGRPFLRLDRHMRRHRFRDLAGQVFERLPAPGRELLESYSRGVNAGLSSLGAPPFEYVVLRVEPRPWAPQDSVLLFYLMFYMLQDDDGDDESMHALLRDLLPTELYEFLTPAGTPWDAPLSGESFTTPPVPPSSAIDLRRGPPRRDSPVETEGATDESSEGTAASEESEIPSPAVSSQAASNAWAVAGEHTAHGGAILAVDTHLGLTVPNIWYRATFSYPGRDGERRISGVTLPGSPLMVIGAHERLAWGFSNARVDASDVILLELDPNDPDAYLTPDGPEPFTRHREILRVRGGEPEELEMAWTRWGPRVADDHRGRPRAVRWLAYDPAAVNLEFLHLEAAESVAEAVGIARRSGLPAQNLVLADAAGDIAWSIAGQLPRRHGLDGRSPRSWSRGEIGWDGLLPAAEIPALVEPPGGRIWTANHRLVDGPALDRLGRGGSYTLGARGAHIRDRLRAMEGVTEEDMLALQLDDRSYFLQRWRDLLLEVLDGEALERTPHRDELRRHVASWDGRAGVDSVGYRLLREYRDEVSRQALGPLLAEAYAVEPEIEYIEEFNQLEGPLWKLIEERPPHLLDPARESWEALMLDAVDAVIERALEDAPEAAGAAAADAGGSLDHWTWGARNRVRVRHFFSRVLPFLGRWLDMPPASLPGDKFMPRVQGTGSGAALRMVVAPGREEEGYFHMPGGQSGHFMSAHYRDSHAAWAAGEPTPLLPGEPLNTLRLRPAAR